MKPRMRIEVRTGHIGEKTGWAFSVCWGDKEYPNFVSALYKTEKEARKQAQRYKKKGEFDLYGSAE